jgi:hypothetical protein
MTDDRYSLTLAFEIAALPGVEGSALEGGPLADNTTLENALLSRVTVGVRTEFLGEVGSDLPTPHYWWLVTVDLMGPFDDDLGVSDVDGALAGLGHVVAVQLLRPVGSARGPS